jgi:hypothetical protein
LRSLARTAITANPTFTPSYSLLAYLSALDGVGLDESIDLLKKALIVSPTEPGLLFALGQAYLQKEDLTAARTNLELIMKLPKAGEYREHAEQLLKQLDEHEARMKEYEKARADRRAGSGNLPEPAQNADSDGIIDTTPSGPNLPSLKAGETRIRGQLAKIECTGGNSVVLWIKTDTGVTKLRATDLGRVKFTSVSSEVNQGQEITCGAFAHPSWVFATFVPSAAGKTGVTGEVHAIDFVTAEMKLP